MARKDANIGAKEIAAERRNKALDLRKAGKSYRAIAKELGIVESLAFRDVSMSLAALAKLEKDKAEELRQLEAQRLDDMTAALWPLAVPPVAEEGKPQAKPDTWAMDRIIKMMERRAALLGLDMPVKTAQTKVDGTDVDDPYTAALRFVQGMAVAIQSERARELDTPLTP